MAFPGEPDDKYGILQGNTKAEVYDPSEEERQLASDLQLRFSDAMRYRQSWGRKWDINRLYLRGEQPLRNRTTGDVLRLPRDDTNRLIAANNILRPTARSLLGKMTKSVPLCKVIPPTADIADVRGAETADSLIYYVHRKERLRRKYIDKDRDVICYGNGFVQVSWDRSMGRKFAECQECGYSDEDQEMVGKECPQCEQEAALSVQQQAQEMLQSAYQESLMQGEVFDQSQLEEPEIPEIPKLKEVIEGDIRVDVVDPREVYIDPSATSLEEADWFCRRVPMSVPKLRSKFPDKAKYIDRESGIYAEQHASFAQSTISIRSEMQSLDNHAYLYEFHERPTDKHKKGRVIWMSNNIILDEVENPYEELKRFPLYHFVWEPNRGEFWAESFIEQAWPLQRELNILLTQKREHRELTNRPKLFAPANAGIPVEEMDTTAGQILYYNPMSRPPHYGEIPPMPGYVDREQERLEGAIRTQASVTEQEAGLTHSDTSGRYAAIIEAQASQQVGPILSYNHDEWKELNRGILILAQSFYTADRRWTIVGSDRPITYQFDQMNLSPGWDIDIQEDDSMSKNPAVRLNQAMELNAQGTFVDDDTGRPDKKLFFEKAGLKMPFAGKDSKAEDRAYAAAIPYKIENGEQFQPQQWDDPDVCAEELRAWLKGPGRSASPQLVQQVAQVWMFYEDRNQQLVQARQQQMMQMQQGGQKRQNPASGRQPSGGGGQPSQGDNQVLQQAAQHTQAADRGAEATARIQRRQES